MIQLSHPYITTGQAIALTIWTFVGKVTSLLSNTLSKFVIAFLPRGKRLLISWLQSHSRVILELKKVCHSVQFFPFNLQWSDGTRCHDLSFCQLFHSLLSPSSRCFLRCSSSSSSPSAIRVVSSAYLRLLIFLPAILIPTWWFIQPNISHDILCIKVK